MVLTRARWVHRVPHPKKPPRKKITPERGGVSLTLDPIVNHGRISDDDGNLDRFGRSSVVFFDVERLGMFVAEAPAAQLALDPHFVLKSVSTDKFRPKFCSHFHFVFHIFFFQIE